MWTTPAIVVVSSVPAFAAASNALAIESFTASYAPDAQQILNVSATVSGFGATGYQLALVIPEGLFDTVTPAGEAPVDALNGATITLTSTDADVTTSLSLGSIDASPWRGFRGPRFTLTAIATAASQPSPPSSTVVAASPVYPLDGADTATLDGTTLTLASTRVQLRPGFVGKVSALVLTLNIPKLGVTTPPVVSQLSSGWEEYTVPDETDSWLFRYRTPDTATGLSAENPGPGDFTLTLTGVSPGLESRSVRFFHSIQDDLVERYWLDAVVRASQSPSP